MSIWRNVSRIFGSSGNQVDVNESGQMHVVLRGTVDEGNSTSTPLAAGAVFTGAAKETLDYGYIFVTVYADQLSAVDGLDVQQSSNGVNWDIHDYYTFENGEAKTYTFQPSGLYFRVVYTNGGSNQSEFRLQTIFKKSASLPSSHRIQDMIVDEDDAQLVKAIITGKKANGDFDNVALTNGANLKASLEELESSISSNSNSQLNVTLFNSTGLELSIDPTTGTIVSEVHEHYEIHEGDHYFIMHLIDDIPINNVYDYQVTTPNTAKWGHFTFSINPESETQILIYEGVTINTPGTTITPRNNNRNYADNSVMTFAGIANTSIANANADTAVAGAILLGSGIIGAGRSGGILERVREIVSKQDTKYCIRLIANTAGYVNSDYNWYEHTNI